MAQYKLTDQEARALATEIANGFHKVTRNTDFDKWISEYMETYNKVMDAIFKYNQTLS